MRKLFSTAAIFALSTTMIAATPEQAPETWNIDAAHTEVTFSVRRGEEDMVSAPGFLIPVAAALAEADNSFSAFVFDPETSTVHKKSIRLGGVVYNDIVVLEGLAEGDIVATAGVSFLSDGQQVTLLDEQLVRNAP